MLDRKKKIYIACGGSAGHIFPGLTLAEELVRRYGDKVEISFLTSKNKFAHSFFKESGFNFYTLPLYIQKEKRTFSYIGKKIPFLTPLCQNLDFISNLFKSFFKSMKIIFSNRPDCFVGFGSYIAGPPFVAATLFRVPTLIHEQNVVMGKANRIVRHFAAKVALSFPKEVEPRGFTPAAPSVSGFRGAEPRTVLNPSWFRTGAWVKSKNIVITGNPIRESLVRIRDKGSAREFLGIERNKFTILIIGGSQGSRTVNTVAVDTFRDMGRELQNKIQVIHVSGEKDYERLKEEYHVVNISYKLYPFFEDMGIIYSATDIAISRAGASTLFELCAHKIPSILIPYPFAESHQVQNASFFAERESAIMIKESELSKTSLHSAIVKLMENENLRKAMSEKIGALAKPDAAKRLAEEVGLLAGLAK